MKSRAPLESGVFKLLDHREPALIFAAHPDDETVSASFLCQSLRKLKIVQVTDGSPRDLADATKQGFATREAYASARCAETKRALAIARRSGIEVVHLGFVDQEPSFDLLELVASVLDLLSRSVPRIIFTHPYEGGHPDHDATAFAVHAAVTLRALDGVPPPLLSEFASYHAGEHGVQFLEFLNPHEDVVTVRLSAKQLERKKRMLSAHKTQRETLRGFPIVAERFRAAPRYYFSRPPHGGRLHYENYDWKMSGRRWRKLAKNALHALHLDEPL
jgi:N-acetylglucosamine malate deacetylase 2